MSLAKRMLLILTMAPAAFLGCDGEPSIGITTALPMDLRPPGAREELMQSMCEPLRDDKNEHIKVMWLRSGPRGGVAFTRTYFCSQVLKENFKALP
jgi:hypothetical protein